MIQAVEITGIKLDLDEQAKAYIKKKIGRLSRYLPRHARKSVSVDVRVKQIDKPNGNKYSIDITMNVPDKQLSAGDTASNILAGVDIVEAKLAGQLRRYKTETIPHIGRRGVLSRFKRSHARGNDPL